MEKSLKYKRAAAYAAFALFGMMIFIFVGGLSKDVWAVPANPHPFYFTQSNGDEITLFFRGDEFFSWWEDDDGHIVAQNPASGDWHYARIVYGAIRPEGQPVGTAGDFAPINRTAILPLIENGWRFDPGNPSLEFFGGQIFRDNRVDLFQPAPRVPALLQPGQAIAPVIPGFNNVIAPETAEHNVTGGQILPPGMGVVPPGSNGADGGTGVIGPPLSVSRWFMPMSTAAAPAPGTNIQTNQRLLVLLVEFDNMALLEDSAFYYNKYFNRTPGAVSVVNYFREMSLGRDVFIPAGRVTANGRFTARIEGSGRTWAARGTDVTITPSTHDGIVHVRMHMNHPITTWTVSAGHEAARDVVSLALYAIHNNSSFDFEGLRVAAVLAGGEAADNYNPGGQVWAHAWQFRGSLVDQRGWNRYMVYGERQRGGQVMGIGIPAHELGHVMGLPDLYDLTGRSEGIGPYSLMAFGSWGMAPGDAAVGHRPTSLDAWSRMQLDFIRPTVINRNWRGNLNSLNLTANNVLKITSDVDSNQFFLVENRQTGNRWDAGLHQWLRGQGGGIMIFHVDETRRSTNPGDMSGNNNNRHRLMVGVREADGSELLLNAVVRWQAFDDHFFSRNSFWEFSESTNPGSHFHTATGRNAATGIEIIIHSERGDEMEVEINFR